MSVLCKSCVWYKILSCVGVTIDGVRIDNWIYRTLSHTTCDLSLTHTPSLPLPPPSLSLGFTVTSWLVVGTFPFLWAPKLSLYLSHSNSRLSNSQQLLLNSGGLLVIQPLHGSYDKHCRKSFSVVASVTGGCNCVATGLFMESFRANSCCIISCLVVVV
jgi:hypothetical protein